MDIKGWAKVKLPYHIQSTYVLSNFLLDLFFFFFLVASHSIQFNFFVGVVVKVLGILEVFMPKNLRSNQKVISSFSSLFTSAIFRKQPTRTKQ